MHRLDQIAKKTTMRDLYLVAEASVYLLAYTWLFGSLLSPFMVLLLWGGTKWKRLHWLASSSWRWAAIWGGFGLIRVIASSAFQWLKWIRYIPMEEGFYIGFLGWPGAVVYATLYVLYFPVDLLTTMYWWIVVSLTGVVEGAMTAGIAATVWWAFKRTTRPAPDHPRDASAKRYAVAILVTACFLGIANKIHSWRRVACCDCFWPHGIPFTFYHEGGLAGGEAFVWTGVIGDILVILLFGMALGWVWNNFLRKPSTAGGT